MYNTDGPRTNNHLEGWHNRLKQVIGKPHPNIFECVEIFHREQMATELLLMQLSTGAKEPRQTLKAKQRYFKIRELRTDFYKQY